MKRLGQAGFATLEVILMVTVVGILAAVAVPRFSDITARANTARIQSDLSSIDTAIALYQMNEKTSLSASSSVSDLKKYLADADKIAPPESGKCFIGSDTAADIPSGGYSIISIDAANGGGVRAALGGKTAGEFYYKSSTSSGD